MDEAVGAEVIESDWDALVKTLVKYTEAIIFRA